MKVIVCGGRDFLDDALVDIVLDHIHKETPITTLFQGGAPGADTLARWWARKRDVTNYTFSADWLKHGKAAGPLRNRRMLEEGKPDMVIAFPGGRGTANMVDQAMRAGVVVEHAARERKDAIEATANAFKRNRQTLQQPSPDTKEKSNG